MSGEKVIVAMSGGVDSSVTAYLLKEQGYQPIGVFMCSGLTDSAPGGGPRRCCSPDDSADARQVAMRLGIPFSVLNFAGDFDRLVDHFCEEYGRGRTPNPCILCNRDLKFGRLFDYADAMEAPYVATGHYARVEWEAGPGSAGPRLRLEASPPRPDGRWRLKRGRDGAKDQSYFLFAIPPDRLERIRLPLGEMTKAEVRRIARDLGLVVHDKPESQEICFVPTTVGDLVRRRRPDLVRPGPILDLEGRSLGRHEGIIHFTIGQRRGLGIAVGQPRYVVEIRQADAAVIVGPAEALRSGGFEADEVVWHEAVPREPVRADVQIRYRHAAAPAWIERLEPATGRRLGGVRTDGAGPTEQVRIQFDSPQPAVTPGQAAVFYRDDRVLGGGWIRTATRLAARADGPVKP